MAFLVLLLILLAVFGRLRLGCLRSQLVSIIKAKSWQELHDLQIRRLEYGLWTGSAHRLLADHRKEVKEQSCMLGISLWYVFTQLKQVPRGFVLQDLSSTAQTQAFPALLTLSDPRGLQDEGRGG